MTVRTPSALLVTALLRRVQHAGGFATMIHKGDAERGAILVQTAENGRFTGFFERIESWSGPARISRCGPPDQAQPTEINQYIDKRLSTDRDLWVIELDIANAQRFAVETITLS